MRWKGRITSWNDEKGYGFIDPLSGERRVFVHLNAFANRSRRPVVNQVVTFAQSTDNQGRACAVKTTMVGGRLQREKLLQAGGLSILVAALFLIFVGVLATISKVPSLILGIYILFSLVTFTAYAQDKSAAKRGGWRTQESTLHLLSLAGGWSGALVARQKLRYKSKKQSFRTVFWITAIVNCTVIAWLFASTGAAALKSLLVSVTRGQ